jgi:hypothetical protein
VSQCRSRSVRGLSALLRARAFGRLGVAADSLALPAAKRRGLLAACFSLAWTYATRWVPELCSLIVRTATWDRYPPDGNLSKLRDLRFCFAFVLPSVSERRPPNDSQPRARTANSTSCRRGSRPPMSPPSQAGEPTACLTDIRRIPADRTVRPGRRSGCWEVVAECRRGQRNGRRRARTRAPLAGALALARMARA